MFLLDEDLYEEFYPILTLIPGFTALVENMPEINLVSRSGPEVITRGGKAENISILTTESANFNQDVLIYNRAPKCASIYLTRMLYILGGGDMNSFFEQRSHFFKKI